MVELDRYVQAMPVSADRPETMLTYITARQCARLRIAGETECIVVAICKGFWEPELSGMWVYFFT